MPSSERSATSSPARTTTGARVLVVEDDTELREGIAVFLRLEGYQVVTLRSGAEMVNYLATWMLRASSARSCPVDAIVTDVRMPGFNGLQIVQGLRAKGWTQPIAVMSAFGDDNLRKRVERLHDAVFLAKPFEPDLLSDTLDDLLHRRAERSA